MSLSLRSGRDSMASATRRCRRASCSVVISFTSTSRTRACVKRNHPGASPTSSRKRCENAGSRSSKASAPRPAARSSRLLSTSRPITAAMWSRSRAAGVSRSSRCRTTSARLAGTVRLARRSSDCDATLLDVARQLDGVERVAFGTGVDRRRQLVGQLRPGGVAEQGGDLGVVEAEQSHPPAGGAPGQHGEGVGHRVAPADLEVAEHHDEQHRRVAERPRQVLEQLQRRLVGPLQIVEHHRRRLGRRSPRSTPGAPPRAARSAASATRRRSRRSTDGAADRARRRRSPARRSTIDSTIASHGHHDGAAGPS